MDVLKPVFRRAAALLSGILACIALHAQPAHAQVNFSVTVQTMPGAEIAGLPAFETYYDRITTHVLAAGVEWSLHIEGRTTLDVLVQLYPESNPPADMPNLLMDTPSTFRGSSVPVGTSGGMQVVEFVPAHKIRTG